MGHNEAWIEQHSNGDEEKQSENISKGNDIAKRLVAEFGFAQNHAGDKGTQSERQTRAKCTVSYADSGGYNGHKE